MGIAGRTARHWGRKFTGRSSDLTADQERTAQQMFAVLGELKGGALKVGQVLSVMEAALPESLVGPYRESLAKMQENAPAMDFTDIQQQLIADLGPTWRQRFATFDENCVAAASLGQVHRATLPDGTNVAVKVQYPGADEAFLSDLSTISKLGRIAGGALPGIDMKPLLQELKERATEELDYTLEAHNQTTCAETFADSQWFTVPAVFEATEHVLITEWIDGTPLSEVITSGTTEQRDAAALRYLQFLLAGPAEAGLLHADPHPGNFRMMPDGSLGVLDFGAVKRLPDGMPGAIGRLLRLALEGDHQSVVDGLREEGFIKAAVRIDADDLMSYLAPFLAPAHTEHYTFTREWLNELFVHVKDPNQPQWSMGLKLNLPPEYLLIHRVWSGGIGMLCQIGGTIPVLSVFNELLPEFAPDPSY